MPSTFTTNTGIEKPASGEQAGSWGAFRLDYKSGVKEHNQG